MPVIAVLYFLLASVVVCPSSALVTFFVPSKINSGTAVDILWMRYNADPAFDLAQYVDSEPLSILSITPVNNSASEKNGTVSVLFSTPGQVTFGAWPHNTYGSTRRRVSFGTLKLPAALSEQKQLTIVSDTSSIPAASTHKVNSPPAPATGTPTTGPTPTTGGATTGAPAVPVETRSSMISSNLTSEYVGFDDSDHRAYIVFSEDPSQHHRPPSVSRGTRQLLLGVINSFALCRSAVPTGTGSSSVIPASPQSTNTNTTTTTTTTGASSAPQRGMSRATVIALAILLPLLILVIGILLYYCWRVRSRAPPHHVISKFTDVLLPVAHTRHSTTTITSPGLSSGDTGPATGDSESGAVVAVLVSGKRARGRSLGLPATRPAPPPPYEQSYATLE
ncbi:hypothetical protein GGX14DRAFT_406047 [Mycena pura]|uniref:Mid2 domain-containing protein n=1 Tax=Mycena pura TaxID=153505 RepID=A0AAD6URE0_9AGAR|nr:hypothetical protein GGX14DRAFT_406047 [Mycena pura]